MRLTVVVEVEVAAGTVLKIASGQGWAGRGWVERCSSWQPGVVRGEWSP